MSSQIDYKVNPRENTYFFLKVITSLALYFLIFYLIFMLFESENKYAVTFIPLVIYLFLFIIYFIFRMGILYGYLKGNAIIVSEHQFADIHKIVREQSDKLGLVKYPKTYILQSGGILNAFASGFMGSNYIVLYSEMLEVAYEHDKKIVEFVIAHELGHIKRLHLLKRLLLLPSWLIPFLSAAYSRACEYTCDTIGYTLCPEGAQNGILLLASGPNLFKKVNKESFINQENTESGFWKWFAEKVSSHPNLTKRLSKFKDTQAIRQPERTIEKPVEEKPVIDDHSKYWPQ
jgi:Zn-dependent protease with chaperone function